MAKASLLERPRNRLLSALSKSDFGLLQPHLTLVDLPLRYELEKPNTAIQHVYFIEAGIASVVAESSTDPIEVGLIGREGMSGIVVLLGDRRTPHSTYMQVSGEGQRISVGHLRKAMKASETIRDLFLKFVQAFMLQTAHTAVANGRATLVPRLARWILMAHDRLEARTLPLTHEFLSLMLGVRRAGVTDTLNILEGEKLIVAQRGQIQLLNRKGLEQRANATYGLPEAEYRRLIG